MNLLFLSFLFFFAQLNQTATKSDSAVAVHSQVTNQAQQGKLPEESFGKRFLRKEVIYSGGKYHEEEIPYLLMPPSSIKPGNKYPMIIWFHGHGPVEYSHEKLGTLNWLEELVGADRENFGNDYYVLAPRCFGKEPWFTGFGDPSERFPDQKGDEILSITREIVDDAISENDSIDISRITATGVSTGGSACWEFAMRNPGLLAAIAPIASDGGDSNSIDELKTTSVWAFHNKNDNKVSIESVRSTVVVCKKHGIHASLTEFDAEGHNAWSEAFQEYNLLDWLLLQQRGKNSAIAALSFEWRRGEWSKKAGVAILLIVILVALVQELRRRKRQHLTPRKNLDADVKQ